MNVLRNLVAYTKRIIKCQRGDIGQMFTPPKSKSPWKAATAGSTGGWAKFLDPDEGFLGDWTGKLGTMALGTIPYVGPLLAGAAGSMGSMGGNTGWQGTDQGLGGGLLSGGLGALGGYGMGGLGAGLAGGIGSAVGGGGLSGAVEGFGSGMQNYLGTNIIPGISGSNPTAWGAALTGQGGNAINTASGTMMQPLYGGSPAVTGIASGGATSAAGPGNALANAGGLLDFAGSGLGSPSSMGQGGLAGGPPPGGPGGGFGGTGEFSGVGNMAGVSPAGVPGGGMGALDAAGGTLTPEWGSMTHMVDTPQNVMNTLTHNSMPLEEVAAQGGEAARVIEQTQQTISQAYPNSGQQGSKDIMEGIRGGTNTEKVKDTKGWLDFLTDPMALLGLVAQGASALQSTPPSPSFGEMTRQHLSQEALTAGAAKARELNLGNMQPFEMDVESMALADAVEADMRKKWSKEEKDRNEMMARMNPQWYRSGEYITTMQESQEGLEQGVQRVRSELLYKAKADWSAQRFKTIIAEMQWDQQTQMAMLYGDMMEVTQNYGSSKEDIQSLRNLFATAGGYSLQGAQGQFDENVAQQFSAQQIIPQPQIGGQPGGGQPGQILAGGAGNPAIGY